MLEQLVVVYAYFAKAFDQINIQEFFDYTVQFKNHQ